MKVLYILSYALATPLFTALKSRMIHRFVRYTNWCSEYGCSLCMFVQSSAT